MLNVVAIMGRLVADPELRTTTQGNSVCSFRIACDRSYVQQGQERQADFIDIVAWRQQADFVSKYFQKGSMIAIDGSLQTRQYQDKNGNNRTAVEVVANNISFAGAKRQDSQNVPSYEQQTKNHVQQAKAAQDAPQPAYTQGSMDDFAVINDNDDLPF
jgi:single-strand DNA-binding protein|nr:MAG TPA: Single strand binding protein [Caudoviricetes sp.]